MCVNPKCPLEEGTRFSLKAWNALPRRDPLQREKNAVVRAARSMVRDEFGADHAVSAAAEFNLDALREALAAYEAANKKEKS
ncbi:hypothetical protein KGP36_02475 [Patescibacteria group bacterium]|nr:hypothetical protein [Patescibacteria group bacterium]